MADLDFSHNVSQIPQGEQLPTYKRSEAPQVTPFPNVGGAVSDYAAATNWMSSLGSQVAVAASNKIATQMGVQLGKKPQGDIGIPLTDFDKVMQKSYETQSADVLGLQAYKLITDSNIELAKSPRITPGLIEKTNKSISLGLQNIFKNAPTEIKPDLEYQYGHTQIEHIASLTQRMITEQKEDRKTNLTLSNQVKTQNIYSSKLYGNDKAADSFFDSIVKSNQSAVERGDIDKVAAKNNIDAARQTYLTGQVTKEYEQARKDGKEAQYLKDLADGKFIKPDNPDYMPVTNSLMNYASHQQTLRSQNDNLLLANFKNTLLSDPGNAYNELQNLKSQVSPIKFQEAQNDYLKISGAGNSVLAQANNLINNLSNHEVFSQTSDKGKNAAYDRMVTASLNGQNAPSRDEAEAQVAASFPGTVPKFVASLNAKGNSTNPADLESLGRQINYMYEAEKGGNLQGLSAETRAMYGKFETLRRSHDIQEAANLAYDSVYNQKEEDRKVIGEQLDTLHKNIKQVSGGELSYFTKISDINADNLTDPIGFVQQSQSLFDTYFKVNHGDIEATKKMVAQDINQNYGESTVNGKSELTLFPIEKFLGIPTNYEPYKDIQKQKSFMEFPKLNNNQLIYSTTKPYSASGTIQESIIDQVSNQVAPLKTMFDAGKSQYYYEIEARPSLEKAQEMQSKRNLPLQTSNLKADVSLVPFQREDFLRTYTEGAPIVIHRVWKNGVRETSNLIVKADPWLVNLSNSDQPFSGAYDVVLASDKGYKPLVINTTGTSQSVHYKPDINKIKSTYMKLNEHWYGQ